MVEIVVTFFFKLIEAGFCSWLVWRLTHRWEACLLAWLVLGSINGIYWKVRK